MDLPEGDLVSHYEGLLVFSQSIAASNEERKTTHDRLQSGLPNYLCVSEVLDFFPMDHGVQIAERTWGDINFARLSQYLQERLPGYNPSLLGEVEISPRMSAEGGLYSWIKDTNLVLTGVKQLYLHSYLGRAGYKVVFDEVLAQWQRELAAKDHRIIPEHVDLFVFGAKDSTGLPNIWIPQGLLQSLELNQESSVLYQMALNGELSLNGYEDNLIFSGIPNIMWADGKAITLDAIYDTPAADRILDFLVDSADKLVTIPTSQFYGRGAAKCRSLLLKFAVRH